MCHAIGLFHEQSRRDRDSFVTINWANIITDYEANFAIITGESTFSTPYSYLSLTHYDSLAFSANGLPTGEAPVPLTDVAYRSDAELMSPEDVAGIKATYGCPEANIVELASSTTTETTTAVFTTTSRAPKGKNDGFWKG